MDQNLINTTLKNKLIILIYTFNLIVNNICLFYKNLLINNKILFNYLFLSISSYSNTKLPKNLIKSNYSSNLTANVSLKLNYNKRKNNILTRTLKYLNLFPTSRVNRTGASPYYKRFYTISNSNKSSVVNMRKFFNAYNRAFLLVYNLFSLDLPILYFSSPAFRKEIDVMNWCFNSQIKLIWRVINPIFTANVNTMTNELIPTLKLASNTGFNIAMITDTVSHRNTLYYTRRCNFYTIGLVPIDSYVKNADFIVPASHYNLLTQNIFHSFIIYIRKLTLQDKFIKDYKVWKYKSI